MRANSRFLLPMLQYFANTLKLMQHIIISKIILGLQEMDCISWRFKGHFLIIFCYNYLQELKYFNGLLDLAVTRKIFFDQSMHASSYYWLTCLTRMGQTICKLLFKIEMWKSCPKQKVKGVDSSPANFWCIEQNLKLCYILGLLQAVSWNAFILLENVTHKITQSWPSSLILLLPSLQMHSV